MDPLLPKFEELIKFVSIKKSEASMAFLSLKTDISKAKKLRNCFDDIKQYMDSLLESYTISGDEDVHREEEKKQMNQSYLEEEKNPQDKSSGDMVTKEDLTKLKKEILNFIQRTHNNEVQQVTNAITQAQTGINSNTDSKIEFIKKQVEALSINNEIKLTLNKIDNSINRIIPHNEPYNLKSLSGQMISLQGQVFLKLSEQKAFIKNSVESQSQGILEIVQQMIKLEKCMKIQEQQLIQNSEKYKEVIDQNKKKEDIKQELSNLVQQNMPLINIKYNNNQLMEKPVLINQFKHSREVPRLIIMCDTGNIVVGDCGIGGQQGYLTLYSRDGKLITSREFPRFYSLCGIGIKTKLFIHINDSIAILDEISLQTVKQIQIQHQIANKLYFCDDFLFVGQIIGYLDIINVRSNKTIKQFKLNHDDINDIIKISDYEYAFACIKGIFIYFINGDYSIADSFHECYLQDQDVQVIQNVNQNILIAGVSKRLHLINREDKQTIIQLGNFDGGFSLIQKIIGYDENDYPYFIIKDQQSIKILNSQTRQIEKTIKCEYDCSQNNSLIQKSIDNEVVIFTIQGKIDNFMIQQYRIATKSRYHLM